MSGICHDISRRAALIAFRFIVEHDGDAGLVVVAGGGGEVGHAYLLLQQRALGVIYHHRQVVEITLEGGVFACTAHHLFRIRDGDREGDG